MRCAVKPSGQMASSPAESVVSILSRNVSGCNKLRFGGSTMYRLWTLWGKIDETRRELLVLVAVSVAILFACDMGGNAEVQVECKGEGDAVKCEVEHTKGDAKVKACWDIKFKCENGTKVTGKGCETVKAGETETHKLKKLKNFKKCDKVEKGTFKVENIKLTKK